MDATDRSSILSAEETVVRRYYNDLLRTVSDPVKLAQLLFEDGMISQETKESIRSDDDDVQQRKRTLLDAVQRVLAQATDREKLMSTLFLAFEKSGVPSHHSWDFCTDQMKEFVAGEYYSVQ